MRAKNKKLFRIGSISLFLVVSSSVFLAAQLEVVELLDPLDKESYLSQQALLFIRPGLDFEILEVSIGANLLPVAKFSIKDPRGLPLDRDGVYTPGSVSTSFYIGRIPQGEAQYLNYNSRFATSPITGDTAEQATGDSGGTYAKVEDGVYTYTFGNALPADYDVNVTHTIGAYARRDLREFNLDRYVDNALIHWVPSGTQEPMPRDVVVTDACNQCHNPLALHGGARKEVGLCILCHTPQSSDPDTGNTVDFKVMIHKVHRGASLPSFVEEEIPYQIIGYRGSVHDYSTVHLPQDIRNCQTCHIPGPDQLTEEEIAVAPIVGGAQSSAWLFRPNRATCGSCHDDVEFATGVGHMGGPQISDTFCSSCHFPEGDLEFDASIKGAHTVPYKSRQLKGLNVAILDVTNTTPSQSPTVHFKLTEDGGTALSIDVLNRISFNLAGPTTDYSTLVRESSVQDAVIAVGDGSYTYTFEATLPADATGSYAIGSEGRRDVILNEGMTNAMDFREQMLENPVFYFSVDGSPVAPRRTVVADANCETCHENLSLHGDNRHDPEYCITCHQPGASDVARRPDEELPVEPIHFKFLIHRIHRGEDLTGDFTVYGYGGSEHDFTEVRFPGDLRDCETCHVNDSYTVPLSANLLATPTPREYFSPLQPIGSACLSCHDTEYAAAHAFTMTTPFGEACASCHGTGKDFSVERVHAR
jgi:OmcA/MtrC family decaheme c-type cytochrome